MATCEYCGREAGETYTLALEWPQESPEECTGPVDADDPGAGTLTVCDDCADTVATDLLVDRAVQRGLDDIYAGLDGTTPTGVKR